MPHLPDTSRDDRPPVVLTVDVEDYFMSPETIRPEQWPSYSPRIRESMAVTLDLLDQYGARATFFFLGWVADRFGDLVLETANRGHEIGTHLYDHRFAYDQSPDEFRRGLERSLEVLHRVGAPTVVSHRAPGFSLSRDSDSQFRFLADAGIKYDSSINPHKTYLYGDESAPRFPYRIGRILEWPPATIRIAGRVLPVGGGGTLRMLPSWYSGWARRRYLTEGWPPLIYFHPWELDPSPPWIQLPVRQRLIHNLGLRGVGRKIARLLRDHRTLTLAQAAAVWGGLDPFSEIS